MLAQYESDSGIIINVYSPDGEFVYKSSVTFMNNAGRISVEERQENSDGSYSLQTPYESGRLLTIRDPQGAFLASDGASGVQDWNIKPIEVEIMQ
jgi:hypothetical protein